MKLASFYELQGLVSDVCVAIYGIDLIYEARIDFGRFSIFCPVDASSYQLSLVVDGILLAQVANDERIARGLFDQQMTCDELFAARVVLRLVGVTKVKP